MKILITGGSGFIGSHLARSFQGEHDVRIVDNLSTGSLDNLAGVPHSFYRGSILNDNLLADAMNGVDYVFHMAASSSIAQAVMDPSGCEEVNTLGTIAVLNAARNAKIKHLIFASTSAVYGDTPFSPRKENQPPSPSSPYAISKLSGEYYCKQFSESSGISTSVLRYFNVYGPRQNPSSEYGTAVTSFILKALQNKPIEIFGDGYQTRDFVYVDDAVRANELCLSLGEGFRILNVGSGKRTSVHRLALAISSLCQSRSRVIFSRPRFHEVRHSNASIENLRGIGFEPSVALEDGLERTIEFFADAVAEQNVHRLTDLTQISQATETGIFSPHSYAI